MFSRPALLVFGTAVVEFFVFVFLAKVFGPLLVTLVAVLLSIGGVYYLTRFVPKVLRQGFRQLLDSRGDVGLVEAGEQAGHVVAGVMLTIPGLLTGFGGLLLLIPPIRKLASPIFGVKVLRLIPTGPLQMVTSFTQGRRGDVIDVESADTAESASSKKYPSPPELL